MDDTTIAGELIAILGRSSGIDDYCCVAVGINFDDLSDEKRFVALVKLIREAHQSEQAHAA
jgi:hypothetical protein